LDLLTHVGEFKNGLLDGKATITTVDGKKFTGQFKEGKFIK
jgi:hypothetical protein